MTIYEANLDSKPCTDGGAAFPQPRYVELDTHSPNEGHIHCKGGLSIRDYFAGQALSGILMNYTTAKFGVTEIEVAVYAYKYADAMLAARNQTK